jgi:hypothetical protein
MSIGRPAFMHVLHKRRTDWSAARTLPGLASLCAILLLIIGTSA